MFDSFIDTLDTEKLLKLLGNSKDIQHNEPFATFLDQLGIKPGNNAVEPNLLIKLYKCYRKRNSITEKKVLKFLPLKYIKALPYVMINFTEKEIISKIRFKKPKKRIEFSQLLKKKFENFIKDNEIYNYHSYDIWFKKTRRQNQLSPKEFKQLYKLYFNKEL